jgi:hypothetical protein
MQTISLFQGLAVALAFLNVVATGVLLFAPGASWRQVAAQTAVIWLLPVVGALLVLHLHSDAFFRTSRLSTLSPRAPHLYVAQTLEAEAHTADHATRAVIEHDVVDTLSHSDGSGH